MKKPLCQLATMTGSATGKEIFDEVPCGQSVIRLQFMQEVIEGVADIAGAIPRFQCLFHGV
ncbi:hypothetical protein [Deinococcus fonticola]|uniref:hypothetical protein n=1 Tax=Deinococcus fonticola TaxID=2528713 RepID=UPI0014302531|nr:hypothetical protein [Deinococcus fonticola]